MARIVVVDDDKDIVRLVSLRLGRVGHEVEELYDGLAGLEAIRRDLPDLAIIDWMMPGLDGIGLAQAVRADALTAGVPLLLLTARSDPAEHEYAREQGFDVVVTKPFTRDQLLTVVDTLLAAQAS